MFRELLNYCVTNVNASGVYSLSLMSHPTEKTLYLSFWSGNVLHQVCIGTGPRGNLIPRKILSLVASFISLFETTPPCISLIGLGERLSHCLNDFTWSSSADNHQQLWRKRIREVSRITNCQNYRETRFQKYPRLTPAEIADQPWIKTGCNH